MTILGKNDNKDSSLEQRPLLREGDGSEAGFSASAAGVPPPSFVESSGHAVISFDSVLDTFPSGGEEPPEFTPYEAEHWVSRGGDIISHDPHLNEDGALMTYAAHPLHPLFHVFIVSDPNR